MAVPALACARGGHAMRTICSAAIWPAWHWVLAPGAERDGPAVVLAKTESAANCVLLTAAELSASAGATGIGAIARNGATRAARGTFRHWPFLGVVSIVSQAHLASALLHAMSFRLLIGAAVTLEAHQRVWASSVNGLWTVLSRRIAIPITNSTHDRRHAAQDTQARLQRSGGAHRMSGHHDLGR